MQRDLDAIADREHDLLVVGGGIVGAAAAWDAAQRGLCVALVEAADFCSGASWNSLKTIHGGLRHLQRLDLAGVRESMRERRALLTIAPSLVRPIEILVPAYGHGGRGIEALSLGVRLADLLTPDRDRGVPRENHVGTSRRLSPAQTLERIPGLSPDGLSGGVVWTDAQATSSERLVLAFLVSAAAEGAALANYVEVIGLSRDGNRITGAVARDHETGSLLEVRARYVLNAAGPALDPVLAASGLGRLDVPLQNALNLVLSRPLGVDVAVGARARGRFLFASPWQGTTLVGTEYGPASEQLDADAFLQVAREAFPWAGMTQEDVCLVHRGRVPGRHGRALRSRHDLVDHAVSDAVQGLLSIVSVKLTTARGVAEQAVDGVVARLGRRTAPCRTATTPLRFTESDGVELDARTRRAVRDEMAPHLDDLLLRRLDLATAGMPAAGDVEAVLGALASERQLDAAGLGVERRRLERALAAAAR